MSNLISGKEALIALANGEEVEWANDGTNWYPIAKNTAKICYFFDDSHGWIFRLAPQTIKITIEVPKPFKPKDGEGFYFLSDDSNTGYNLITQIDEMFDEHLWLGKWQTEEEIIQVRDALRGVFNDIS